MPRTTAAAWIEDAAATLDLSPSELLVLTATDAAELIRSVGPRFVDDPTRRWWWERLRRPNASLLHVADGRGFDLVASLVPSACERVLLVACDGAPPMWPVFDVARGSLAPVLGQCPPFEYLILAGDHSWLMGENHHDVVFAAGDGVVERFRALVRD
jgi:hypothetical protein